MAVTTRKRKAPAANLPAAADLKHPTSSTKAKSTRVDFKDDDPFYDVFAESSENDSEAEVSDYASRKRRKNAPQMKKRKTKKSSPGPAPEAPEMSDIESESHEDDSMWSGNTLARSSTSSATTPKVLSIKLDTGSAAPTVLNLDLSKIIQNGLAEVDVRSPSIQASPIAATSSVSEYTLPNEVNFLSLPRELRDKIYKLVLAAPGPVVFNKRLNFKRSAQMLRASKTVAEEGAMVLYGMNAFHFERTAERRGTYYNVEWKEVGFKDVRRFLRDIGPTNISHMRYVSFTLEDAAPYLTPYLPHVERLFVNDAVLQEVFRIIGRNTVLNKLAVEFCSRPQVTAKDFHFLRALSEIKCKNFHHHSARYSAGRIHDQALDTLRSVIVVEDSAANVDLEKAKHVPMTLEKPRKSMFGKKFE